MCNFLIHCMELILEIASNFIIFSNHIIQKHIHFCYGKSRFWNIATAILAIESTLDKAGEKEKIIKSMGRKKKRKCLKAHLNFSTGCDTKGNALFACKIVITGKGWIVTSYSVQTSLSLSNIFFI